MFIQIIGDIVALTRIQLTLLRKLKCVIFQQTIYGRRDVISIKTLLSIIADQEVTEKSVKFCRSGSFFQRLHYF